MAVAVYDNPITFMREGYRDGQIIFALSLENVNTETILPLEEFQHLHPGQFKPTGRWGDINALPFKNLLPGTSCQ